MFNGKPLEFYLALVGSALFVFQRTWLQSKQRSVVIVAISTLLGYSLAPDVSLILGRSETLSVVLTTTLIFWLLDLVLSVIQDVDTKNMITAAANKISSLFFGGSTK